MRYLLFVLALLASISVVTVPRLTYAGDSQNDGVGEHNGAGMFNCGSEDDALGSGPRC
jgi:hypothetical protein